MAQVYRKSALEKLSSPDQIDKALTIVSPMSWLAIAAATAVVVVTIIWSIVGTIPVTVTAKGIIASPVSTNAIYMPESGRVQSVGYVYKGMDLAEQDVVLTYITGTGEVKTLLSDQNGTVDSITVKAGEEIVKQGDEVLRLNPATSGRQVVVCYVSLSDSKKISRGMEANITLSSAESQTYGHMYGRVVNVDSYVSSTNGISYVLGSGNEMVSVFKKDFSDLTAITLELLPAYPDDPTQSGYWWSNEKGKKLDVPNGSVVTAKIITEEVHPITKLFVKLKEIWGS